MLTAVGLATTVAGPLLVSRLASEPNDDVILSRIRRRRWLALTWTAFVLFLAAAYAYLIGAPS